MSKLIETRGLTKQYPGVVALDHVDFDLEPVGPLERLTFRAHRNGGYYEELLKDAIQAA